MSSEINMTEKYFEWWLEELKAIGLVISYEREPQTFTLFQPEPIFYNQHYKVKDPIVKSFNLFQPTTYTPDYKVVFSSKLVNKLFGIIKRETKILYDLEFKEPGSVYQETLFYAMGSSEILYCILDASKTEDNIEVWFDVKPPAKALQFSGSLGSSREFPYNQRLMYEKHNIIVNKVVPIGTSTCLFAKTFLPRRYRFTDKSGQLRKLKSYENSAKNLEQYLKTKNIILFQP